MASDREMKPLAELCLYINRGAAPSYVEEGGILVINQRCIREQRVDFEPARRTNHVDRPIKPERMLHLMDILVNSTGVGTLGRVAQLTDLPEPATVDSHVTIVRPDLQVVDPKYLGFAVRLLETKIEALGMGSTGQTELARSALAEMPIPVCSKTEQRAISAVLSAFDDKIELNRQMNATLEEIARAIFKSWFVDFDPVHAKARGEQPYGMDAETAALFPDRFEVVDGREVPAGWTVVPLADVADVNARSISKDYDFKEIEYVDISSVSQGQVSGTSRYQLENAPSRARRLVKHGDTIWSTVRPNRRSYLFIDHPVDNLVVSTGFAVLTPRKVPATYLYMHVTTDQFVNYLVKNASGSAYPAVRAQRFEEAPIIVPPKPILDQFGKVSSDLMSKFAHNSRESQTLAEVRDTLLPKLMSGEIRVPLDEIIGDDER